MPHCRPMMNTRPQITIVEEMIRIPAWRSASPKKRSTPPLHTSRNIRAPNFPISPNDETHSRGTASQPPPGFTRSPDHRDLGVRREQRLGEDVVAGEHAE